MGTGVGVSRMGSGINEMGSGLEVAVGAYEGVGDYGSVRHDSACSLLSVVRSGGERA